jgi:two-component system nitrogen regulation response regulator NtrX
VFQPVGSTTDVEVDVRVVSATNKDLEAEIRAGRFREDLFFRLNVIPLHVPPLRERREDVPLLVDHYLGSYCRDNGRREKQLADEAMDACMAHDWPGNVRELRNVMERIAIMEPEEVVGWERLPRAIRGEGGDQLRVTGSFGSLKEAREAFEREFILKTLREQDGNVSATARALDLERSSLYRKARTLRIPLDGKREPAPSSDS